MLGAYNERRQRELQAEGSVMAIAAHDPKRLSEIGAEAGEGGDGDFDKWNWKAD